MPRDANSHVLLVVSYGAGVDSTAMLVEFVRRQIRPDYIVFADTGGEKEETLAFLPIMDAYLKKVGFPGITVVRYVPRDFKHWPPYSTLEENCLTNGTLPSLAFGFKSCSQKWKIAPLHTFLKRQPMVQAYWQRGLRVAKCLGFDAGPADLRRRNHMGDPRDRYYDYRYPLIDWGWNRERCTEEIAKAGLPVPPKSSCFFCPVMKPSEVRALPAEKLRRIVMLKARAAPRLVSIQGLWRREVKGSRGGEPHPRSMTAFIRHERLLPEEEIDCLMQTVPTEIMESQRQFHAGYPIPSWEEFLAAVAGKAAGGGRSVASTVSGRGIHEGWKNAATIDDAQFPLFPERSNMLDGGVEGEDESRRHP